MFIYKYPKNTFQYKTEKFQRSTGPKNWQTITYLLFLIKKKANRKQRSFLQITKNTKYSNICSDIYTKA